MRLKLFHVKDVVDYEIAVGVVKGLHVLIEHSTCFLLLCRASEVRRWILLFHLQRYRVMANPRRQLEGSAV